MLSLWWQFYFHLVLVLTCQLYIFWCIPRLSFLLNSTLSVLVVFQIKHWSCYKKPEQPAVKMKVCRESLQLKDTVLSDCIGVNWQVLECRSSPCCKQLRLSSCLVTDLWSEMGFRRWLSCIERHTMPAIRVLSILVWKSRGVNYYIKYYIIIIIYTVKLAENYKGKVMTCPSLLLIGLYDNLTLTLTLTNPTQEGTKYYTEEEYSRSWLKGEKIPSRSPS